MPEENKKEVIKNDTQKSHVKPAITFTIPKPSRKLSMKLHTKLMLSFIGIVLVAVVIVLGAAIRNFQSELKLNIGSDLQHLAQAAAREINVFMERRIIEIKVLSQADIFEGENTEAMNAYLKEIIEADPSYNDLFVLNRKGVIIACSNPKEIGETLIEIEAIAGREVSGDLIERAARAKQGDVFFKDAHVHTAEKAEVMFFTPITDEHNINVVYVLAMGVNLDDIERMVSFLDDKTVGDKSTYLVNDPGEVIFTLDKNVQILRPLPDIKDNPHLKEVLEGDEDGYTTYRDHEGDIVLAGYADLKEYGVNRAGDWSIITVAPLNDIFAPVNKLRTNIIQIGIIALIIAGIVAFLLSRGITNPIRKLVDGLGIASSGDLTKEIEVRTDDEIGDLGLAFNSMITTLAGLIQRTRVVAMHIVSASTQILSASQQHAIGAAQQSSQITEVTGALNELVAVAKQVSLSADEVARISDGAVKTAESGSKAVADTIATNTRINNSVKEMAKKVETLGRKSKKITGILDLLDDITEQTNLLAINAAIEAAKAGEAGKGFTVVANEIRKLADSSRKATKDISVLIEEIQADTQETVTGMKESTSLVDEGTSRATSSGDAIKMISFSIEKSAQSVKQIALAAQQQTTGAAQVSRTMADVNAVVKQGMAGTEQSLRSAKDLAAMAEQLKASMAQFRIRENGNRDN